MIRLAPNLLDTDFERLTELGRSLIPRYAPDWTDHNIHDPGIMLIELLAWTAEAQIYSLARMRTDERRAYAALVGLKPPRPKPARVLLWREGALPGDGRIVAKDTVVTVERPEPLRFRLSDAVLVTAARLDRVTTRALDGGVADHGDGRPETGATFQPFGEDSDAGAVLVLHFTGEIVPAGAAGQAHLALGVRASGPAAGDADAAGRLEADLVAAGRRYPLPVVDGSEGMTTTGAILLGLDAAPAEGVKDGIIEFRPVRGRLPFAPRVSAIEINVLPAEQVETHEQLHLADEADPDLELPISGSGALFEGPSVTVAGKPWMAVGDLAGCGPGDEVFLFDEERGRIRFGNGVNGRIPRNSYILVSHQGTAGAGGNLPAGFAWRVPGYSRGSWTNRDSAQGGETAADLEGVRVAARRRVRGGHLLVTAGDLEEAALALADLGVARAETVTTSSARRLVVLRTRGPAGDADAVPETSRWLAHVAARLRPRLMLGERLSVVRPDYVRFGIEAELLAEPGQDPGRVEQDAIAMLERLFAAVPAAGNQSWKLGREVEVDDIRARLRRVPGVARVLACALVPPPKAGPATLPMLDKGGSHLLVRRPARA